MENLSKRFLENLFCFLENYSAKRFVLAVSGGVDSMVLLDVFLKQDGIKKENFCVATLDHGIRKESYDELNYIKKYCVDNGISFFGKRVNILELRKTKFSGQSTEQAAREERMEFLFKTKMQFNADFLVTAHHKDDLAETFLTRILRGTGLNGMNCFSGENEGFLRPLMIFWKKEIFEYAKENSIFYFNDSTNSENKYLRNKIRNNVIPYLEKEFKDFNKEIFIREQRNFSEANKILDYFFDKDIIPMVSFSDKRVEFPLDFFNNYPEFFRKEILLRVFQIWKRDVYSIDEKKLTLITDLLDKKETFAVQISKEIFFISKNRRLSFEKKETENTIWEVNVDIKNFPEGQKMEYYFFEKTNKLIFEILNRDTFQFPAIIKKEIAFFDLQKIHFPLFLRNWKAGDNFFPSGAPGRKKISRFLTDLHIPSEEKKKQLVLLDKKNDIIWCVGQRISQFYKADENSNKVLKVEFR